MLKEWKKELKILETRRKKLEIEIEELLKIIQEHELYLNSCTDSINLSDYEITTPPRRRKYYPFGLE